MANYQRDVGPRKVTIKQVNDMDFETFKDTFGEVIENTPLVAAAVWSYRPFRDLMSLQLAFTSFVRSDLCPQAKAGLVRCYPDLQFSGRGKLPGELSRESLSERTDAGLYEITASEDQEMTELNKQYRKKFCFPFVICVRENNIQTILTNIRSRMRNEVADEMDLTLKEISKIACLRLKDLVEDKLCINSKL